MRWEEEGQLIIPTDGELDYLSEFRSFTFASRRDSLSLCPRRSLSVPGTDTRRMEMTSGPRTFSLLKPKPLTGSTGEWAVPRELPGRADTGSDHQGESSPSLLRLSGWIVSEREAHLSLPKRKMVISSSNRMENKCYRKADWQQNGAEANMESNPVLTRAPVSSSVTEGPALTYLFMVRLKEEWTGCSCRKCDSHLN